MALIKAVKGQGWVEMNRHTTHYQIFLSYIKDEFLFIIKIGHSHMASLLSPRVTTDHPSPLLGNARKMPNVRSVSLLLDQGFKAQACCFYHPLSNDMTISLSSQDLEKFLISIGRQPSYVDLEATPMVGKDQPPDLAFLVPSGVPHLPNPAEKAVSSQHPIVNHVPIEMKSTEFKGNAVGQCRNSQGTIEKPKVALDPLVAVTDVRKFVEEIIKKTSEVVLSELNMENS